MIVILDTWSIQWNCRRVDDNEIWVLSDDGEVMLGCQRE